MGHSVVLSWLVADLLCGAGRIAGGASTPIRPRASRDWGPWPGNVALLIGAVLIGGLAGVMVAGFTLLL